MKIKMNSIRPFIGMSLLAMLFIASCSNPEGVPEEENGESENCPKPMAWLSENPIPEPDYENFPCGYTVDSADAVTNSAFHEISWQYFLWLTEEVTVDGDNMLRFESMYNDEAINLNADDPNAKTHILGGIQQAGSNSVLVDNNGRAVYTSMMINDVYRDFVVNNKLNTSEGLENFPADTNFDNGSMSIKAAWKIIPENQIAPEGAYTRKATIYDVVKIDGNLTTSDNYKDPAKQTTREETVALVGFHIAVVIKDHPEFIWATFEHNDNAPNYIVHQPNSGPGVPSSTSKTFYKAETKPEDCNVSNLGALSVDEETQVISQYYVDNSTTQVYRNHQYGGGSETNQDNIERLNKEVHDALPSGSIWKNYSEVGAVWFDIDNGHLVPNWSLTVDPNLETGSKTLSNSVIETFTQDVNNQNSCFSCHNTMPYTPLNGKGIDGKNVLTSHILLKNYINTVNESETVITIDRKE